MNHAYGRISAVLFAAGISGTVTNVSVTVVTSSLAREWHLPLSQVAVSVLALNVAMAFVMPLAGLAAGRYGIRGVMIAGGVTLALSTILLLFAEGAVLLTVGRLGQGAGMAAVAPTAVQASNKVLTAPDHARALGWWSAANGAGLAIGPVLGGALFDVGGWRLVPLPTLLIAVLFVAFTLRGVPRGMRHEGEVRLYGVVMISLMAGIGVALLSAISIGAGAAALGTGAGLVGLIFYSLGRRRSELPFGWLGDVMVRRSATGASVQMFVNGMVQVAVPAWLVTEAIASSGGAGVILLAMTLTMTVMGLLTGRKSYVPYGQWFRTGAVLCALGAVGLSLSASVAAWWFALPTLVVAGVGAGALLTPSFQAFSSTVPGKDGVGLAMYNLCRLLSFAVGGIAGAAAVDADAAWLGFLITAGLCLVLLTRSFPRFTVAAGTPAARDAGFR